MSRHVLTRADIVDYAPLAEELGAKLGRPIALSSQAPDGDEPGVLVVIDGKTGEPLDADDSVVAEVVKAHSPRASAPDPLDVLAGALETATTLPALRAALISFAKAGRTARTIR